jgi:DNA-binding NarL/FixJ family response regulator
VEVCWETGTLHEALAQFRSCLPDLAIVDLTLPDGNGLGLIKRLRACGEHVRILVCSMHDEALFARRALAAGAQGYISKFEATAHVLDAIRCILGGQVYLSDAMTARMLERVADGTPPAAASPVETLTDRELEVLGMIGQGRGTKEIARALNLGVKTVETHRQKIKRKLNLTSSSELVCFAAQWVGEGR